MNYDKYQQFFDDNRIQYAIAESINNRQAMYAHINDTESLNKIKPFVDNRVGRFTCGFRPSTELPFTFPNEKDIEQLLLEKIASKGIYNMLQDTTRIWIDDPFLMVVYVIEDLLND